MNHPTNIYYKGGQEYESQVRLLETDTISKRNKELIRAFQSQLFINGTSKQRVAKVTLELRKICKCVEKDLDTIDKPNMNTLMHRISTNDEHKDATKADYKRVVKQFYRWYEDDDPRLESNDQAVRREAQKLYSYLKKLRVCVDPPPVDPGSIITDEEISTVLKNGCRSDMERAFIKVLHETGCRVGEVLDTKLKDLQKKDTHWVLRVDGKTGERQRPILDSIPYLLRWLDSHPDSNNSNAYLWTSISGKFYGRRLLYWGARRLINRCFERARLSDKKYNPHFFRHSRATLDATKYSDSIQAKIMGWRQGSRQLARYRHMSGTQVEDSYMLARGIKKHEEVAEPQPVKCLCGRLNEPLAKYCSSCGKTLSIAIAHEEQEYMNRAFGYMKQMFGDPEMLKRFEEWKQKRAGGDS